MTEQTFTTTSDPADFTVDQVNAYLESADESERTRVLDAEKAGKDRSTVKAPEAKDNAPQTVEQAGETQTVAVGEKYEKGYDGFVPSRDGDDPQDLSLKAVTAHLNQGA